MNSIQKFIYNHLINDIKQELIDELQDKSNQRYIDLIHREVDTYFQENNINLDDHVDDDEDFKQRKPITEKSCKARTWQGTGVTGYVEQCSFNKCEDSECFCRKHHKKYLEKGFWWLGTIDEPIQECYIHYNKKKHYPENYIGDK
tara:strand:+ start:138 stop:572 length:435 start_codon:yes stop_codon:yes gene_type:complete